MKSYLILIFIIFINLSNHSVMAKGKKEIKIIPTPQIEKVRDGNFSMIGKMNLFIPENVQLNSAVFELHNAIDEYPRLSFTEIDNVENAKIVFELDPKLDFSEYTTKFLDEAYVLDIGKELITIKARSSKGLFYGAMSLVQLIENSNNNLIKSRRIIDWPDMGIRGISDDISRGQVSTMDNFKRIIRFISKYKMNTYMPYLEDMLKFEKVSFNWQKQGSIK
jgi:hexosaminidase